MNVLVVYSVPKLAKSGLWLIIVHSNNAVNNLLKGDVTLPGIKPAYRQALIRSIAAGAGIDLCYCDNGKTVDN